MDNLIGIIAIIATLCGQCITVLLFFNNKRREDKRDNELKHLENKEAIQALKDQITEFKSSQINRIHEEIAIAGNNINTSISGTVNGINEKVSTLSGKVETLMEIFKSIFSGANIYLKQKDQLDK